MSKFWYHLFFFPQYFWFHYICTGILHLKSLKFRKTVHIFKIVLRNNFFSVKSLCSCVYGLKCSIGKILIFSAACINTCHILMAINEPWWLIYGSVKIWMNVGLKSRFCKLFGWTAARNYVGFPLLYSASQPHWLSVTSVHLRMKPSCYLFPEKPWAALIFGLCRLLWAGTAQLTNSLTEGADDAWNHFISRITCSNSSSSNIRDSIFLQVVVEGSVCA